MRVLPTLVALALLLGQGANGGTETGYAPRIPDIQHLLHISNGVLGSALLGWSAGMFISVPIASRLIERFGTRPVFVVASLLYWGSLASIALARTPAEYFACLLGVGLGNGPWDVTFGVMASRHQEDVKRRAEAQGRSVRTHRIAWDASFSLLSVAAAVAGSVARAHHVPIALHLGVIAVIGIVLTVPFVGVLPNVRAGENTTAALPRESGRQRRRLYAVAVVAGAPIGAVYAWATKDLAQFGVSPIIAGLGLDGFALCQGLVQIAVWTVSNRIPRRAVVGVGGMIAAAGAAAIIAAHSLPVALTGFALLGAGLSATFSYCFDEMGAITPEESTPRAMARTTLAIYGGLVAAQPVMGWTAQLIGLRFAWGAVLVCGLVLVVTARSAFRAHVFGKPE